MGGEAGDGVDLIEDDLPIRGEDGSVLMPYGGKYQLTETQTMVAKLPVLEGKTDTVTMMSYGFDPYLGLQFYFSVLSETPGSGGGFFQCGKQSGAHTVFKRISVVIIRC